MYHSALKQHEFDKSEEVCERFEFDDNIAFVYDINKCELPIEYDNCDVLYIEPSWKSGIQEFNKRAKAKDYTFLQYKSALESIVEANSKPVILVAGKDYANLPYNEVYRTKLNGYSCYAYVFGNLELKDTETNKAILHELANKFNRIGDFCCGYGLSGRIFLEHGRKFTMSDYNGSCIHYIKENISKW